MGRGGLKGENNKLPSGKGDLNFRNQSSDLTGSPKMLNEALTNIKSFLKNPVKWQVELPEPSLAVSSRARPSRVRLLGPKQAAGREGALELRAQLLSLGTWRNKRAKLIQPIIPSNTRTSSGRSERVGRAVTQEGLWTE